MKIRLGSMEIRLSRYLGLWSVVVVLFAMQGCMNDAVNAHVWSPADYLRWSAIQWLTWAALAPLVFRLGERHPIQFPLRLRALGRHVMASLGMTLLAIVIGAMVSAIFEPSTFGQQLWQFISKYVAIGLLTYWALLAVQHLLYFQAEKARRELEASRLATELAQSRLQVLKTQLQPHFLFNTLHAIVTLLDEDTLSAEDMLLRLSELLRAFLEDYDGQEISLRRELELLDLYLGIQRRRFKDRLSTQIYVAPEAMEAAVPSLVLQPIVENAIRHGIGRHVGEDCIEVDCRREDDTLCIDVRNRNSALDAERSPSGHGIGLSNTRLRLKELYGEAADLRLDVMVPRGVACRIRLPYREIEADDDLPEHVPA
ncbi:sensor histidine kinase [Pseudoxanthomonas putridarboris]|uniref:Histidine kinase n=1 Tax=Pseudoxanthomonas putridarboris TaxID=752605 RepID=A0ABU9IW24_9GAMM